MKRVLITGASGFIGYQCLSPLLAKGYEVHAVARAARVDEPGEVRWHQADLLDSKQVQGLVSEVSPTHLLHVAWYVEPGALYHSPANCEWVQASLQLLRVFRESGGRRCVMVGTGFEYDLRYGYCTEGLTPCNPTTVYGCCKSAMQQLLAAYSDAVDLSSAWARIFYLYGPREKPMRLVASVVRALLREEPALCSSGEQIYDYLHVTDAASALVSVLNSDVEGPINIGSGRAVTIREIVNRTANVIGRPDLIRFGAIPKDPDSPSMAVANVSRLTEEVGWLPHFDLVEGLRDTVNWWGIQLKIEENV